MYIAPLVDVLTPVSIGTVLGTNVSLDLIGSLNAEMSAAAGGIVFGSADDPHADMYHHFNKVVDLPLAETASLIKATNIVIEDRNAVRPITSIEELERGIPASMHEAILTFPPIRKLVKEGSVFGFGYDYDLLPSEDRTGRLIHNGSAYFSPKESEVPGDNPSFLEYEFHSDDPLFSADELDDIQVTREWMQDFLDNDEESYDLTDWPAKQGKLDK